MVLPTIVSFWHGPISWLEQLCIQSYLRQGHPVCIFSYAPIEDLPSGARWYDASAILPQDRLVFYKGKGTPAVFSDWFRLELLRKGLGIYSDLDVYCVAPIKNPPAYVMAWEHAGSVNNAVLAMPSNSLLLEDLLQVFTDNSRRLVVPYLPPLRRAEVALRRLLGESLPPQNMQFGATGPMPLTYFVRQHGLDNAVMDAGTFYPVPYEHIPALRKTGSELEPYVQDETLGIHLWRSQLTDRGRASMPLPEPDSALALLCKRDGIPLPPG